MNTQTFMQENRWSIKMHSIIVLVFITLLPLFSGAIEIDFSRRKHDLEKFPVKANIGSEDVESITKEKANMRRALVAASSTSEIVIINTKNGFVPATVSVQVGRMYRFHVVNINREKKNVSFVMPSHNQHHSTYFGELKVFSLDPKHEGIFSFECPETASEGRIVVLPAMQRDLASEVGK